MNERISPPTRYHANSVGNGSWEVISESPGRPDRRVCVFARQDFADAAVDRWNSHDDAGNPIDVVAVVESLDPRMRPVWGKLLEDHGDTLTVRFDTANTSAEMDVSADLAVIWLPPATTDPIGVDYARKDAAIEAEKKYHRAHGSGEFTPVTRVD